MNNLKIIFNFIKITRPINVFITFIVVIVAVLITQQQKIELLTILLAAVSAAITAAAGNIINDIYDLETDKISHPNRVLVKKNISVKQVWIYYFILNTIAIIIAGYISITLLSIVLIVIFLLFLYSSILKRLPLIGNITISFITGLVFIYGGILTGNPFAAVIPGCFAFLINLIREIVKDIQDVLGDSKSNFKTFPVVFGIDKSKRIIFVSTLLLIVFTFYPFISQLYKIEYFLVIMILVNPILIVVVKKMFDKNAEENLGIISNLLKMNMVIGLIAIWLGK